MIGPALFLVFDTLQDEKLEFNNQVDEKNKVHVFVFYVLKKHLDGR